MRAPSLFLLVGVSACYVGVDDEPHPEIVGENRDQVAAEPSIPLAAAGWLDHEDSLIVPWCGAVLVAPDVAVTAARCVDGWSKSYMHVGFGDITEPSHEVVEIVVDDETEPRIHALAALRLAEPVHEAAPAVLDRDGEEACEVRSVAYEYMGRGDSGSRWMWSGCLREDAVMATSGAPNCHGDLGAGAFLDGGALAGIAVDATTEHWAENGCMLGHRLATVSEHEAFFDLALGLSATSE